MTPTQKEPPQNKNAPSANNAASSYAIALLALSVIFFVICLTCNGKEALYIGALFSVIEAIFAYLLLASKKGIAWKFAGLLPAIVVFASPGPGAALVSVVYFILHAISKEKK